MPEIEIRVEAMVVREGKILLANHEKRDESYWVLPGGHLERSETLIQAVARELKEEFGVKATVGALALVHEYVGDNRQTLNLAFRAEIAGEPRAIPQGKLKSARWVPLADLDKIDLRPPIAAALRRVVEQPRAAATYWSATA